MPILQGTVGEQSNIGLGNLLNANFRLGPQADLIVSELHGKYFELCRNNRVFSDGGGINALSANTITLTATTTPILGVWNKGGSPNICVPLFAILQIHTVAGAAVDPGAFVWATSLGNNAISTGRNPINRKTQVAGGSQCAGMYFTALTAITNNLVVRDSSMFGGLSTAMPATAVCMFVPGQMHEFFGCDWLPAGGVLALLNTISSTTVSVSGTLVWAEVPAGNM